MQPGRNVGFVSFRFAGTDGVSLETAKWQSVLEGMGHNCFFCAGELDTDPKRSHLVPKAQFKHPEVQEIYPEMFNAEVRKPSVTKRIHELRRQLKRELYEFVDRFRIEVLVAENTLAIPLNVPLGLALTELIAETGIPTIAHHHDLAWERKRFMTNCVWDYLRSSYPPRLNPIQHVVINSSARNQLALRTGANAYLIPNVMDFHNPPKGLDDYNRDVRAALGVGEGDTLVLQPTRVVQRKGIEHAIELVKLLDGELEPILVISHASGDEGFEYEQRVKDYTELLGVRALFVDELISHRRGETEDGRKIFTLDDVYPHADLVTYPSLFEGFGNAFLETIYHKKPIFVNNYSIYSYDIRPKGFRTVEMEDFITDEVVAATRRYLQDSDYRERAVEHNFATGRRHFSYKVLERDLDHLLMNIFGLNNGD